MMWFTQAPATKSNNSAIWFRFSPWIVLIAGYASSATGQQVFHCKNLNGRIAIQDRPCSEAQGNQSSVQMGHADQNTLSTTYQSDWQSEFNKALTQGDYEKANRLAITSDQKDAVQATIKSQKDEKRQAKLERIARIKAMTENDPVTCSTNFGSTSCSNGKSYYQNGDFTYGSDGSSAHRVGNTTVNSNGTSFNHIGNQSYGSDGRICSTIGTITTCSGGR